MPEALDENTHIVRLANHINELLRRVVDTRGIITIQIGNSHDRYSSALLKATADEYLILDEIKPRPPYQDEKALVGKDLIICANIDGVALEFNVVVTGTGLQNGVRYYTTAFPTSIRYEQKRGSYRVSITLGQKIAVQFQLASGRKYRGEMYDISLGGISIALRDEMMDERTPPGIIIPDCVINLPGVKEPFRCKLELRNVRKSGRMQLVGTSYFQLTPRQQRIVEKYVATMDRKRLQQLFR